MASSAQWLTFTKPFCGIALDNQGNVIDSDYTNGTDLGPGELQVFDTMHKNNPKYSEIQLYVKEVS